MRGYTIIELVSVLILLGVGAATAVSTVRRFADRAAVIAAREEVIGALVEARGLALEAGGSRATFVQSPAAIRIAADGSPDRLRTLDPDGRVVVDLRSSADSVVLPFDALGLGRFASRTIELRRGAAKASVIVSSYGRVRRR